MTDILTTKQLQDLVAVHRKSTDNVHNATTILIRQALKLSPERYTVMVAALKEVAETTKSSKIKKICMNALDVKSLRIAEEIGSEAGAKTFKDGVEAALAIMQEKIDTAKSLESVHTVLVGEVMMDAVKKLIE